MNKHANKTSTKSQTEVTQTVLDFLGKYKIFKPDDLIPLIKLIKNSLEFRDYNDNTKKHADSIQWKRTVTEILKDGYVYRGKACSDLVMILITLCKASGLEAQIVKLANLQNSKTHTIAEIKINGDWYGIDPNFTEPKPFKSFLQKGDIWNKDWMGGWQVWEKGSDLWSLGLDSIDKEGCIIKINNKK